MERSLFENLVLRALDQMPAGLRSYVDNVDVVVSEWPTQEDLGGNVVSEEDYLLGFYEGVPLTERDDYGMILPDKITLFQGSIEAICTNEAEIVESIWETVVHEVAHHFGIDDDKLEQLTG